MNRGKPLKRGKGLERGRPLRADPEKVRAFLRKHGGGLARTALERKPRRRPPEGPLSPAEWRKRVFDASGGRCVMSGSLARDVEDRRFHGHHIVPKRVLRARGLFDCVWDSRNGCLIRADLHLRRVGAEPEIPYERLPRSVHEFAAELDAREGTAWASSLLLRLYPPHNP